MRRDKDVFTTGYKGVEQRQMTGNGKGEIVIEKYCTYKVDKMLQDYQINRKALELRKQEYKYMDGTKGVTYGDKVSGTKQIDGLPRLAERRIDIENRIRIDEADFKLLDRCISQLPERERIVVEEFYINRKDTDQNPAIIAKLTDKLHLQESRIYDLRRDALEHLTQMIFA